METKTNATTTEKGTLMNWFFVKPNGKVSRAYKASLYATNNAMKVWPAGTDIDTKVFKMTESGPVFVTVAPEVTL